MKVLIAVLLLAHSGLALAEQGPCENFAKYGALKAYKFEPNTPQNEMDYAAKIVDGRGDKALYQVTVSDKTESGKTLKTNYYVTIQAQESSCKVVEVLKTNNGL